MDSAPGCKKHIWFLVIVVVVILFYGHSEDCSRHFSFADHWTPMDAKPARSMHSVLSGRKLTYTWPHWTYRDNLQPWVNRTTPRSDIHGRARKRLPQVICMGVKKCGTTALDAFLRAHPKVKGLKDKPEGHFFDSDAYDKGLEYYRLMMEESSDDDVVFEKTPSYFVRPRVASRIAEWNKDVKLILVLCDPVMRSYSDYVWIKRFGGWRRKLMMPNFTDFDEYVNTSIADMVEIRKSHHKTFGYGSFHSFVRNAHNGKFFQLTPLTLGMYITHLNDWYTHFPYEQIHIVDGDRLISDPGPVLEQVQRFIGAEVEITADDFYFDKEKGFYCLKTSPCIDARKGVTRSGRAPVISRKTFLKLSTFYKPYNEELFQLLNKTFEWSYFFV